MYLLGVIFLCDGIAFKVLDGGKRVGSKLLFKQLNSVGGSSGLALPKTVITLHSSSQWRSQTTVYFETGIFSLGIVCNHLSLSPSLLGRRNYFSLFSNLPTVPLHPGTQHFRTIIIKPKFKTFQFDYYELQSITIQSSIAIKFKTSTSVHCTI